MPVPGGRAAQWLPASVAFVALALSGAGVARAESTQAVRADDPRISWVGRFDWQDPAGPRVQWSNSAVILRFVGRDLGVRIAEEGDNYYQVVVDGRPTHVLHPERGTSLLWAARGLPRGDHSIEIVRRTEPMVGTSQFLGFVLDKGARLLSSIRRPRRLEVIGASIAAGFGLESPNEKMGFVARDQNGYLSYGARAARELEAEFSCIAWSGKGMGPYNNIAEVYFRTLALESDSTWDFSRESPDAIVVHIGDNDFRDGIPGESQWTSAYVDFLRRLRVVHPRTLIYLATGPLTTDAWPPGMRALSTLKRYVAQVQQERAAGGDSRVRQIHFATRNDATDGFGGAWHPSARSHAKMADQLVEVLRADLGWDTR